MTDSESDQQAKRKRKSKLEQDGRDFSCKHCDKTYFSTIALNNHVKTKHGNEVDVVIRGRGRPRKYEENIQNSAVFDDRYKIFFDSLDKKKGLEEEYDYKLLIKECIASLFSEYNKSLKSITSEDDFSIFDSQANSTDSHMLDYLAYVSTLSSKEYYNRIVKLILLFRECLNIKFGNGFTSTNKSSKNLPETANDFLTDFMEVNENFGMDFTQILDITQHFCHWLLINNLTSSKLSLIN